MNLEQNVTKTELPVNQYFVDYDTLKKYVPPYFNDADQTPEPVLCETEGEWPSWIKGSFVRVGTGRYSVPLSDDDSKPRAVLQHFFDALGMLHKFDIANGKVKYNSRYTTEGVVRKAKKNGRLKNIMCFGVDPNTPLKGFQDPCQALLRQQQSVFIPTGHLEPDELNINVVVRRGFSLPDTGNPYSQPEAENPVADEVVVQTEGPYFQVCDSRTLEPKRMLRFSDIDPKLQGQGTCAHFIKDRNTGEIFNYLVTDKGELTVFALDIKTKPSKLIWHTKLPGPPCYCHSLAATEKYVVFIRNPITIDLADIENKTFADSFVYDPDCPVFFFIVERSTGSHIATYKCPNFMFFHSVNAYDYVDELTGEVNVHIDLCSYDGQESRRIPYKEYSLSNVIDPIHSFENGYLVRYECANILGEASQKSVTEFVCDSSANVPRAYVKQAVNQHMELPRINKAASCNPSYRYVYACGGTGKPSPGTRVPIGRMTNGTKFVSMSFFASIVKSDWETGEVLEWKPPNGESCPCEPMFCPNPARNAEDDGYVLTIVCDRDGKHSILICLEAKTMKEVARAHMPHTYSLAPHGTFVDGDSMFSGPL
ncbi:uncharacterized protein AC631_05790 [Debaryomyces fabryi]|uniref:Uncharacterized protein n=1 Tax=Debaryomyces fabryi TaxID=58627 RepID=A0A0V1PQC8_9ASCO|nr:uncharacterized protein AC631_05790 [Debaryomyces fabryi]KRZ98451.1 hypothetical protein AC631_05790 [Debaryomyces fabryi]CUM49439.1 unnamed protein product [Debaryomyces fabryi]